jgi:transposase-like protein
MRRYSEAMKADVRVRMSPPNRQSMARISEETGIHPATLYLRGSATTILTRNLKPPEGHQSNQTLPFIQAA